MRKLLLCLSVVSLLCFLGCQRRVNVSGKVLYDGKPASDIVVLLEAKSQENVVNEAAMGKTNANGEFSLTGVRTKKPGVVPGEYIGFFGWEDPAPSQKTDIAGPSGKAMPAKKSPYIFPKSITERKYTFNVTSKGMSHLEIKITKDDVVW